MPRKTTFPPYPARRHSSGQARIKINGKQHYLGCFGTPESWAEYDRLLGVWRCSRATSASAAAHSILALPVRTVADLAARFWTYAKQHYRRPDGSEKEELVWFQRTIDVLLVLFGSTPVDDFGPKSLKVVQAAMASGFWRTEEERQALTKAGKQLGWCRRVVNRNVTRVKTIFSWAVSEELIGATHIHALRTVRALPSGSPGVIDHPEVVPVPEADLEKTMPKLGPVARELVELLLLTGARPSELLRLTPADIDRSGSVDLGRGYRVKLGGVWAHQPQRHKTSGKGKRRVILFGPAAQQILAKLLASRPPEHRLFRADEARARQLAILRACRRSKVQPSQTCRKKPRPLKQPGDKYTVGTLGKAVRAACKRAAVAPWTPYQLRHNAATRLVSQFGPRIAQLILGHSNASMTELYALPDLQAAAEAMAQASPLTDDTQSA